MQNFAANGGAYIQSCIDRAVQDGSRRARITGCYEIEQTVRIPSHFTLLLEDCHLRMAKGTFCNLFTNQNCGTPDGRTVEGADRDIVIEGRGRAILDGGEYNGLSERNAGKDGRPPITVNNLLLFANVEDFSIRGLHCRNQRWWAMNFVYCRRGKLQDLDFCSDPTLVHPDGSRTVGLRRDAYAEVYIKNSDGIDLRQGCHDMLIENITGFTEDDSVALTALNGFEKQFAVEGLSPDIRNVIIRNVNTAAFCSNVRLLNQGDIRLYNILIDGVTDASQESPYMDRGIYGVRVGDAHMYGDRHSTADETFNICIRNVYSRAATAAVQLCGEIRNLQVDNIRPFDGCPVAVDNQAELM